MDLSLEEKVIDSVMAIVILMVKDFKDGVQASDFADIAAKIMANEELKKEILEVYNSIDKVKSDVVQMSVADWLTLSTKLIPKIIELINAVRA